MALEVVTGSKNDKIKKNDQECVYNKRTQDGTCSVLCVAFLSIDNKCTLSCAIIWSKQQSNKELRIKQWCLYFDSSFLFFQDCAIKAETDLELVPFIFRGPKLKQRLARLARDQQRRYRSHLIKLGDQVERWRELCKSLDIRNRKLAK